MGSYLVLLLDELVSKWGIGSGSSLFLAAGVAQVNFRWNFVSIAQGNCRLSPYHSRILHRELCR